MNDPQRSAAVATAAAEATPGSRGRVAVISAMIFAALLTIAYWTIWFGVDRNILASSHAASYYAFENAFPAADGWLTLTLLLGALGIARRRPWGLLWGLLAGGAGVYLGCMDVLFDLENGIYLVPKGGDPSAVIIEVAINVLTFLSLAPRRRFRAGGCAGGDDGSRSRRLPSFTITRSPTGVKPDFMRVSLGRG